MRYAAFEAPVSRSESDRPTPSSRYPRTIVGGRSGKLSRLRAYTRSTISRIIAWPDDPAAPLYITTPKNYPPSSSNRPNFADRELCIIRRRPANAIKEERYGRSVSAVDLPLCMWGAQRLASGRNTADPTRSDAAFPKPKLSRRYPTEPPSPPASDGPIWHMRLCHSRPLREYLPHPNQAIGRSGRRYLNGPYRLARSPNRCGDICLVCSLLQNQKRGLI